jgi:hypothetical protein
VRLGECSDVVRGANQSVDPRCSSAPQQQLRGCDVFDTRIATFVADDAFIYVQFNKAQPDESNVLDTRR